MRDEAFLNRAKKESLKSDNKHYHLGCVIARGKKILGVGHNLYKTHPKSPHEYKSMHAEFMATMNAGFDIKGATVYVFRGYHDGTPAMARPCRYCWQFLMDAGVKKVVYSCEGTFKAERVSK